MKNRSHYKETWTALAPDERSARLAVAGHLDDPEWNRSAGVTLTVLTEKVGIHSTDEILEIGCGIGRVGRVLAPLCRRWVGADISPGMIACAREYLAGIPNAETVELAQSSLAQFPEASFDLVYCTVVFMHLYEWDRYRYVTEALRILRPGGRCYFDNVDITTDHGWGVFMQSASYGPDDRPSHTSMVSSADELLTYGQRAGFKDVQVRKWGGAWVALTGTKPA